MSNTDVAIAIIRVEHRALEAVLHTLQALLNKVAAGYGTVEFGLLSAVLYYIDDFQERCHHPKEEEYLFKSLRAATSEFNDLLDSLQAAHLNSAHALSRLHRDLVHYQGGARNGLEVLQGDVDHYVASMHDHIRVEEDLLERSRDVIGEANWARIAAAFNENDDPLFGNNRSSEFGRLYQRMVLLAPQKVKQGFYRVGRL